MFFLLAPWLHKSVYQYNDGEDDDYYENNDNSSEISGDLSDGFDREDLRSEPASDFFPREAAHPRQSTAAHIDPRRHLDRTSSPDSSRKSYKHRESSSELAHSTAGVSRRDLRNPAHCESPISQDRKSTRLNSSHV